MKYLTMFFIFICFVVKVHSQNTSTYQYYEQAYEEIKDMLEGRKPLSFKRAVFVAENAYYNGTLDWIVYCHEIEKIKETVNKMITDKNLQVYKTAGNWAIFTFMNDSIPENNYNPFQYDFENFMGDKDFESFMVSSLLRTKKGNCHSLPYLYKILADEVNVEAYLSTAPMHLFIKHKDEQGKWWNLETTSGTFSRTSFIIEQFNVTTRAIETGLYMKPLSDTESVVLCLIDLLGNYDKQFSIYSDDFVRKCYKLGLKYYPNSLLQTYKINDIKFRLDNKMKLYGIADYSKTEMYPELAALYKQMNATMLLIKDIGYEDFPAEKYEMLVKQIEEEIIKK